MDEERDVAKLSVTATTNKSGKTRSSEATLLSLNPTGASTRLIPANFKLTPHDMKSETANFRTIISALPPEVVEKIANLLLSPSSENSYEMPAHGYRADWGLARSSKVVSLTT